MKRSLLSILFLVLATVLFAQEKVYTPTLKSPENNADKQMPNATVSWNAIAGTLNLKYQVQVDTTTLFNSPVKMDTTQVLITGYTTRELYFNQKYYWRVRAIDEGLTSGWSEVWNFTVFNAVELSKPAANAVDQDPNVSIEWLNTITTKKVPITGITHYDYQVDTDPNFGSPGMISGTTGITVLKAAMVNLHFGQKYYWRVRAGHSKGNTDYSAARNFTVIDDFLLQTPADKSTDVFLNIVLKWKNVKGLLAYGCQVAKDAAFTDLVEESEVDTNFLAAQNLKFGVKYYWRVRGRHMTDTSSWSTPFSFTSINTVVLKSPGNDAQDVSQKPLLQWTKQTGIIGYELLLDSMSTFQNPIVNFKPGVNDVQYQVGKTLKAQTKYYWKMRAFSNGGIAADTSDWSPVWSFTTTATTGFPGNYASQFKLYPNPANGKIFLKMDSKESATVLVQVIDLLGKKIIETSLDLSIGQNNKEISLENVTNGIYILRMVMNGNTINQKFVVEK